MTLSDRQEAIVQLLGRTRLFEALLVDDRAACAEKFREIRFSEGETVYARGDPGTHLYIVREGRVRLTIAAQDGRESPVEIANPGDLFGGIALLDGQARGAGATALAPTVALALERDEFHRLRAARPAISEAVIGFLCQRVRDLRDQQDAMSLYPLEMRLARFLLTALRGARDAAGRRTPMEVRYSQGELAMMLGASRPNISAALATLEMAGAIGRAGDRLSCDRAKLSVFARWDGE